MMSCTPEIRVGSERGNRRGRIKSHTNCWAWNSLTACLDYRGPCSKSIKSICKSSGIYVIQVRNLIYNLFENVLLLESQTDLEPLESYLEIRLPAELLIGTKSQNAFKLGHTQAGKFATVTISGFKAIALIYRSGEWFQIMIKARYGSVRLVRFDFRLRLEIVPGTGPQAVISIGDTKTRMWLGKRTEERSSPSGMLISKRQHRTSPFPSFRG